MRRLTELAHEAINAVLKPGDAAIDATAGNGHDTRFLAECVGETGRVYAFDIQQAAIDALRDRVPKQVLLFHADHASIAEFVKEPVKAVTFNLGYLPGGDHAIVTKPESSIAAFEAVLPLLTPGGVITIIAYRDHPGGKIEADIVKHWIESQTGVMAESADSTGPILHIVRKPAVLWI